MFMALCKRYGKQLAALAPDRCRGASAARQGQGEKGFVLITVMFVMVLLLVLALAAANSVVLETIIAGNHRQYNENFYAADGAALEGAQLVANESDCARLNPLLNPMGWIDAQERVNPTPGSDDAPVQNVIAQYDDPAAWAANPGRPLHSALSDNQQGRLVRQMAVRTNLTGGDLANSVKVRPLGDCYNKIYQVYGLSQTNGGRSTVNIAIGYLKDTP